VVAKFREGLAVNKQRSHRFQMELFKLTKLKEAENYRFEVSNRFSVLEDLDAEVDINSAWETTGENIKASAKGSLGYCELKKHKSWLDEGCSELLVTS
jgi:hypothetical protein